MYEKKLDAMRKILRQVSRQRILDIVRSRPPARCRLEKLKPSEPRTDDNIRTAYKNGPIAKMGLRQAGLSAYEERSFEDMQRALSQIAHGGLATVNSSDVVKVAYAMWHQLLTPQLNPFLGLPFAADAAFLVDRLTRFNCVSRERKIQLLTMLGSFKPARCVPVEPLQDPLAVQWGASRDLKELISASLPLQSRSAFVPTACQEALIEQAEHENEMARRSGKKVSIYFINKCSLEAGIPKREYACEKRNWWRSLLQWLWR